MYPFRCHLLAALLLIGDPFLRRSVLVRCYYPVASQLHQTRAFPCVDRCRCFQHLPDPFYIGGCIFHWHRPVFEKLPLSWLGDFMMQIIGMWLTNHPLMAIAGVLATVSAAICIALALWRPRQVLTRPMQHEPVPDLLPPGARFPAPADAPRYGDAGSPPLRHGEQWAPASLSPSVRARVFPPPEQIGADRLPASYPSWKAEPDEEPTDFQGAVGGDRAIAESRSRPDMCISKEDYLAGRQASAETEDALEIEAGRLAYRIPPDMWRGVTEKIEVRLSQSDVDIAAGFTGRGPVKIENTPIVETMSVDLDCEPGAFRVEAQRPKDQLVKPDRVKNTLFKSPDFARWVWRVTPLKRGDHTLLVTISASILDSRGLPAKHTLPDKIFPVTVRVHIMGATFGAISRAVPSLLWVIVTTLVGIFTKDYWWPFLRDAIGLY
jgi:hypothetical protein